MDPTVKSYAINTVIVVVIAVVVFSFLGNDSITAFVISIGAGLILISGDLPKNLFATLFMAIYPVYSNGDVVVVNNVPVATTPLTFSKLGILRTAFTDTEGNIVLVPNADLLNDYVKKVS